jgi:5'-methylthioadenosine phosphorylase
MTNMPEVKLAREAELCYATVALVTDYDVWHESEAAVSVEAVIANLLKNAATAKDLIRRVVPEIGPPRTCPCPRLLEDAIITPPERFPPAVRKRLDLLIGKYFPATRRSARRPAGAPRKAGRRRG